MPYAAEIGLFDSCRDHHTAPFELFRRLPLFGYQRNSGSPLLNASYIHEIARQGTLPVAPSLTSMTPPNRCSVEGRCPSSPNPAPTQQQGQRGLLLRGDPNVCH